MLVKLEAVRLSTDDLRLQVRVECNERDALRWSPMLKITVSRPYCMYSDQRCIYSDEEEVTNELN